MGDPKKKAPRRFFTKLPFKWFKSAPKARAEQERPGQKAGWHQTPGSSHQGQPPQVGAWPLPEVDLLQRQLRDALEKNQQWLVYDQQREAYVQSVVAKLMELEQELAQTRQQQMLSDRECQKLLQKLDKAQRGNYKLASTLEKIRHVVD